VVAAVKLRNTSSSHSGLGEWLLQRITAVYLGLFIIFVGIRFLIWPIHDHQSWQAWFTLPWVRVIWLFAFFSLLLHAWIGIRSVLMDYVKPFYLRLLIAVIFASGLITSGLWVVDVLYRGSAA
jgi:succinate dehydrogenase / fumarate reductase membrane anchor subunit